MPPTPRTAPVALLAVALLLGGCAPEGRIDASTLTPVPPTPTDAGATVTPPPAPDTAPRTLTEEIGVVAGELDAPWSVVRLASGSVLVSQRDAASIVELLPDGSRREAAVIHEARPRGEAGLLGIAVLEGSPSYLYAYFTTDTDNRIVRYPLLGEPGGYGIGPAEEILTGIPAGPTHDGGRIAWGPDGMLYATTGDAGQRETAQDPASLGGKILRLAPDGAVPPDNPQPGSPVYSLGHRNPQGIAWDPDGRLWAAEFGQNTWDELNLIEPGQNYGWPVVEGRADDARFRNPVVQWSTAEASPSGLTAVGGTLFLAGLGGERLFVIQPRDDGGVDVTSAFEGRFGRIRTVLPGPEGTLWVVSNNTDGRGSPAPGDDRIYQVVLRVEEDGRAAPG